MNVRKVGWPAVLVVLATLAVPGPATADWFPGLWNKCPKPAYSPARWWSPTGYRAYAALCGPKISVDPPDRHPEVLPRFQIVPFKCQGVDSATQAMVRYIVTEQPTYEAIVAAASAPPVPPAPKTPGTAPKPAKPEPELLPLPDAPKSTDR